MADEELDEDLEEGVDEGDFDDDEDGEGGAGKKRLLIVVAAVLVLILGGAAAAYFTGLLQPVIDMLAGGEDAAAVEEVEDTQIISGDAVFFDLQEMLVNINTGGRKAVYLKIRVSLELQNDQDIVKIEEMMPRIVDNFQIYLRELRIEDLKGSAGMYRLREELLKRVNVAVAPAVVNDVLFKEMLVQ
ncbi:flagellar basal body-associated FliL family protein [Magnetovibrio sp. PR-2]|uniref:flagellar basal body-associated FliL family protein n=1 Tax=Magnetovibrio sp. PR-2 TaxID=3120356 RepID=UPI002FCDF09E